MSFRVNWLPVLSACALLTLAYLLQKAARPFVLDGSVQQQYYAHLGMVSAWILACIGLAQPGIWHAQRATRRATWVMVALGALFLLYNWFCLRHQVAIRLAPGVWQLQNP